MNQIDLILENIRLGHINQLILEATSPDEVNRGIALINESMQNVYGAARKVGAVPAALLGAAGGAALGGISGALSSVPDTIARSIGGAIGDDDNTTNFGQQAYDGIVGLGTLGALGGGVTGGVLGARALSSRK
jgi:hypothetical protein